MINTSERIILIVGPAAGTVILAVIFVVVVSVLRRRRKPREKVPTPGCEVEDGKRDKQKPVIQRNVNEELAQENPIYEPTLPVEDISQGGAYLRMQNRLGSSASTSFLWQPNQETLDRKAARKSSKFGKINNNPPEHYSYSDNSSGERRSGRDQEGYENLAFSHDESNIPTEDVYSTIGHENAYETVANIRDSTIAEEEIKGVSHVYDRAESVIETTGTKDGSDKAEATNGGSIRSHIYDRAEETITSSVESVRRSQGYEEVHDIIGEPANNADTSPAGNNIHVYDSAEGYEGQPLATPKGTHLSREFSKSVLSNTFANNKEKSFNDYYEDDDYDSPEDIIMD